MTALSPVQVYLRRWAESARFAGTVALDLSRLDSNPTVVHKTLPSDDPKLRRPNLTEARRIIGYELKVSLDQGLDKAIASFMEKLKEGTAG